MVVGGAPGWGEVWGGPARRRGGSMLVAAAPIVFESPTELTTPPEVVHRRADRSLFSFSCRLFLKVRARRHPHHFDRTPVPRERVHSSVRCIGVASTRLQTRPLARGLPAPCQTHHRVASTPAAAEGIGAARVHFVWSVSMRAVTGGAAAADPPRAPLGAPRLVPK